MQLYISRGNSPMLTIRGADQVITSLRAARKSLGDGRATSESRIEELDHIIGELAVGTKSYVGDPLKSKQEIEALVASIAKTVSLEGEAGTPAGFPPGVDNALAHFRRAVATLQRVITADVSATQ